MVFFLYTPTLVGGERFTEVRFTLLLGFVLIIGVGTTIATAINRAEILSGKGAKLLLFGWHRVSSNAKLMENLMMGSLG